MGHRRRRDHARPRGHDVQRGRRRRTRPRQANTTIPIPRRDRLLRLANGLCHGSAPGTLATEAPLAPVLSSALLLSAPTTDTSRGRPEDHPDFESPEEERSNEFNEAFARNWIADQPPCIPRQTFQSFRDDMCEFGTPRAYWAALDLEREEGRIANDDPSPSDEGHTTGDPSSLHALPPGRAHTAAMSASTAWSGGRGEVNPDGRPHVLPSGSTMKCHHLRLKVVAYRRQMELDPEQLLAQVVEDGRNRRLGEDVGDLASRADVAFCAAPPNSLTGTCKPVCISGYHSRMEQQCRPITGAGMHHRTRCGCGSL